MTALLLGWLNWLRASRFGRALALALAGLTVVWVVLARYVGMRLEDARLERDLKDARRTAHEQRTAKEVRDEVDALPGGDALEQLRRIRERRDRQSG